MFMFHAAFSLGLISLTAGSALFVYSSCSSAKGTCFANTIASIVIFFSITSILCTSFYGVKYWMEGYFQSPICAMDVQDHSKMNGKNIPVNKKS